MLAVQKLIELDRESPKRLAILGDAIQDCFVYGRMEGCQDGCAKFVEGMGRTYLPGGAANAARQLTHWNSTAHYIGLGHWAPKHGVDCVLDLDSGLLPQKERFLVDDKIVFRNDREFPQYGLDDERMEEIRQTVFDAVKRGDYDGVLLCDYDKGMLTQKMIRELYLFCQGSNVSILVDAKRHPRIYEGLDLQVNEAWEKKYGEWAGRRVITRGRESPMLFYKGLTNGVYGSAATPDMPPVPCINHVGAGDCFAAHMILSLAHGLPAHQAAEIAHSAGRVYVQHQHHRPPWPHEIGRDNDPVGGKLISLEDLPNLRASAPGRIVFTNGVFRLPHAGHCWLLDWARKQGDVLVVGINDDCSAWRQKPGEPMLPLTERIAVLAGLSAVDYIVPFGQDDPIEILKALKANLLIKGADYRGWEDRIPGASLVEEVRLAPESLFPRHCRDIVKEMTK